MILEAAVLYVKQGQENEFEKDLKQLAGTSAQYPFISASEQNYKKD